ncbi:hypothetical protein [Natronolimnohabitans innermongolicus]|uniref:Uncharacterized protein n=1 Tax=Natronolimnohabitans innermongolicus JCM 12255 TaxID=1227499 RepID=L9WKT0_9EURY|nr:hypothetical protein [Natronolimnohabitans innermongolicus]ELY50049.1 hypothetical protein C493_19771 [Natronolimnohabitans innermongolicus JCM 12255]
MELLDRLKETLSPDDPGVEYRCPSCDAVFDTAYDRCPECGEIDMRERGGFDFRTE